MTLTCESCGWTGQPDETEVVSACPKCFKVVYCPLGCEGGHDHVGSVGRHYAHRGPCSWHDGPCEKPIWCNCPGLPARQNEKETDHE